MQVVPVVHVSPSAFFFFSQGIFEVFCATYSDMRSPFLRGQGRDLLQPAAPVTGWITHGSVQETCQLLKAAVKHFAPHLKKMPSGLHFDKEGKSVSLYCGAVHYTQPTWAERHSKAKR